MPVFAYAEYTPEELCAIPWGDGVEQLKHKPAEVIPPDPDVIGSDYETDAGSGPSDAFVDKNENIIFYSFDNGQLKGFNNAGQVIFDFSYGAPDYNSDIFTNQITGVYVDSLLRLYVADDGYSVSVVDYGGNVLEKLYPFAPDSTVHVSWIYPKYDGRLCFDSADRGLVTYSDGEFSPGCSAGFIAANGSYYSIWSYSLHSIKLNKYQNPDSTGLAETREFIDIGFPNETIYETGIMSGGDGSKIYLAVTADTTGFVEIWELGLDYNLLNKMTYNAYSTEAVWGLTPFIHANGNIYEFRCLEDGLHVFRWNRQ